jgi:hypothetical protein
MASEIPVVTNDTGRSNSIFSIPYDPKKASELIVLDLSVATSQTSDNVPQYRGCS